MPSFRRRTYLFGRALSVCALVLAGSARAEQLHPVEEKHTLAELVGLALGNTQILSAQTARVDEHRLAATQARMWPKSSLEISGGRRSESAVSGHRFEVSFEQPIGLLGKPGLRGGLLDLESESWAVRRAATEIAVTLAVIERAYEYSVNRRTAGFVEQRRQRFKLVHDYLGGRVFATPQGKAERSIIQNRLKILAADATRSEAGYKASFEKLKAYVPLESGEYPAVEIHWFAGTRALNKDEWLARALAQNPDIRGHALAVKSAEIRKSLAAKAGLPDPSLVMSYEEGKTAETEKNYGLGVSLALPSWNRNKSGIKSAEAGRLAEERMLGFEKTKLAAELSRLLVEYEAARRVVEQYPLTILSDLDAQLKAAESGFRKGQLDLLTFLELDNSAAETFGRVVDAQLDLVSKAAELLSAAGVQDALSQIESF